MQNETQLTENSKCIFLGKTPLSQNHLCPFNKTSLSHKDLQSGYFEGKGKGRAGASGRVLEEEGSQVWLLW